MWRFKNTQSHKHSCSSKALSSTISVIHLLPQKLKNVNYESEIVIKTRELDN